MGKNRCFDGVFCDSYSQFSVGIEFHPLSLYEWIYKSIGGIVSSLVDAVILMSSFKNLFNLPKNEDFKNF